MGRYIPKAVERRLYAEAMGRCMNPSCQEPLLFENGDIIEIAHIDPYRETADNSFENLVLLCPNCHTKFDKTDAFTPAEILGWKQTRREENERFFNKKFTTFDDLRRAVVPLLSENKEHFENYYLKGRRELWDKFEGVILANNRKLKMLFLKNLDLFQRHHEPSYSNLACVHRFIAHIDEFEATRCDEEKSREILFPTEINSMFGIAPVGWNLLPLTESLELLINRLRNDGKFEGIVMGTDRPFLRMKEDGRSVQVFLEDTPRLRQLYHDYRCFRKAEVRLDSLNFALRYIRSKNVPFRFLSDDNIREIIIQGTKIQFVYKYCLSKAELERLLPEEDSVVVNLHNWNGDCCISEEAYETAARMNVTLMTSDAFFYEYLTSIKQGHS